MTIGRRLNVMTHWCVVLSITAYALAVEQPALLLIALAILGLEFAFISRVGGKHLPRWTINALLLAATLLVFFELTRGGEGYEFVSVIGRYLIWLQLIKLAEPKTPRNQGQALALTAMLAVGAVLTNVALVVGAVLLAYLPLLLAAVVTFQIYAGHVFAYGLPKDFGGKERRGSPRQTDNPNTPIANAVRRSWSKRPPRPLASPGKLGKQLGAAVAFAGIAILLCSIALFIIIPRGVGESILGSQPSPIAGGATRTGLGGDFQLGRSGVISESQAVALYVQFSRDNIIIGSPQRPWYLRANVFDRYDEQTGRWARSTWLERRRDDALTPRRTEQLNPAQFQMRLRQLRNAAARYQQPRSTDLIQRITIRDNRNDFLLAVWNPLELDIPARTRRSNQPNPIDGTIRRPRFEGLVDYTVRSRQTTDDLPTPLVQAYSWQNRDDWQFTDGPIAQLARDIAERAGLPFDPETPYTPEQRSELARAIELHLASRYAYTLNQPPLRQSEDPIEAFLFRTRQGHCEYFASASAALASALQIRARVVTGYHVSEWEPNTQRYIVRASSAHAWTEVETRPATWQIIDPSADDVRLLNRPDRGLFAGARRLIDQLEFLWVTRVVTFSSENQRNILQFDASAIREFLDPINDRVASLMGPPREGDEARAKLLGSIVTAIIAFIATAAIATAAIYLLNRLRRTIARRDITTRHIARLDRTTRKRLAFYPKMLATLKRLGLPKPDHLPPNTHADHIETHDPHAAQLVRTITNLYYTDRFGQTPLNQTQLDLAAHTLARLRAHHPTAPLPAHPTAKP